MTKSIVSVGHYLHVKTGGIYEVVDPGPAGAAISSTNSENGRRFTVYRSLKDGQLYVRDEIEFAEPGRFVRRE